jgi:hypothetical protein
MEYQPENKKWEDWVFDDKDHALVIEFEIRPDAGPFGLVIGSKIFRRHRPTTRSQKFEPEDYYYPPLIDSKTRVILFHTFWNGDKIEGWMQWQSSNMSLTGFSDEICARLSLFSAARQETWHYEGYVIGFGKHIPEPPSPPPYPPYPPHPPDPYTPVPGEAAEIDIGQADLNSHELFPYIYVQPWPSIPAKDLHDSFISVPNDVIVAKNEFWANLIAAKKVSVEKMLTETVTFIEATTNPDGGSEAPPDDTDTYKFIDSIEELGGPFTTYGNLWRDLEEEMQVSFETLSLIVDAEFGGWKTFVETMKSGDYQNKLIKIWNSAIALNICLGYRHALLEQLIVILRMNQVFDYASAYAPSQEDRKDESGEAPEEASGGASEDAAAPGTEDGQGRARPRRRGERGNRQREPCRGGRTRSATGRRRSHNL